MIAVNPNSGTDDYDPAEELHRVLFMHFVVPHKDANAEEITIRQKARELGYLNTRPYYSALENAYHVLLGKVAFESIGSTGNPLRAQSAHTVPLNGSPRTLVSS